MQLALELELHWLLGELELQAFSSRCTNTKGALTFMKFALESFRHWVSFVSSKILNASKFLIFIVMINVSCFLMPTYIDVLYGAFTGVAAIASMPLMDKLWDNKLFSYNFEILWIIIYFPEESMIQLEFSRLIGLVASLATYQLDFSQRIQCHFRQLLEGMDS